MWLVVCRHLVEIYGHCSSGALPLPESTRKFTRWRRNDIDLPPSPRLHPRKPVRYQDGHRSPVVMAMSTFQKVTLATCLVLCVALLLPKMLLSRGRKDAADRPEGASPLSDYTKPLSVSISLALLVCCPSRWGYNVCFGVLKRPCAEHHRFIAPAVTFPPWGRRRLSCNWMKWDD